MLAVSAASYVGSIGASSLHVGAFLPDVPAERLSKRGCCLGMGDQDYIRNPGPTGRLAAGRAGAA